MQNFLSLPEITVRILVRPTIGHLLYWRQFLVKRISGCVKVMTPQRVAQKTFDSSFPVMALNRSGNANDRKYPKPKEDICINWPTVLQELLG